MTGGAGGAEAAAALVADALDGLWSGSMAEAEIIDALRAALDCLGRPWQPPVAAPREAPPAAERPGAAAEPGAWHRPPADAARR